jgi:prepilin-type N-terminal cleavage/methylation domain-containing protein
MQTYDVKRAPRSTRKPNGFTLVELLVVIAIIGLLAAVVITGYSGFLGAGQDEAAAAEFKQIQSTMDVMMAKDSLISVTLTSATNDMSIFPTNNPLYPRYLRMANTKAFYSCTASGLVSAAGTAPGQNTLFSNPLNNLSGFTSLMGSWQASAGVLSSGLNYQNRLVSNSGPWTDFKYQTTATLVSGPGYGLYYRCDSNPNITGYVFQFDPGLGNKFNVRKVVAGAEFSPFQTVSMPGGFQINAQHDISVSVQGDHHIIKVDGATVLDFHDSQYSSGTVGLRSWGNSSVKFTSFNVNLP